MSLLSSEQVLHDRVNLSRLVRRLDKVVAEDNWSEGGGQEIWLKSQGMLQKIKHARRLLKNVEPYDEMEVSAKFRTRHEALRIVIDRLESVIQVVDEVRTLERVTPKPSRPTPLLPTIPLPPPSARRPKPPLPQRLASAADSVSPGPDDEQPPAPEADLLLGPADDSPPDPVVQSKSIVLPSSSAAAPAPAFLQNSAALQEELSAQLAQMAGQLRRNAIHFSEALAKDQAVMGDTEEKIGANYDVMKKERVRLRDHRGKSMGTTCLTFLSLIVVLVAFVIMFFVIRIT